MTGIKNLDRIIRGGNWKLDVEANEKKLKKIKKLFEKAYTPEIRKEMNEIAESLKKDRERTGKWLWERDEEIILKDKECDFKTPACSKKPVDWVVHNLIRNYRVICKKCGEWLSEEIKNGKEWHTIPEIMVNSKLCIEIKDKEDNQNE
ncbi:hypothetical protein [endosymbiont GvMRE of Glomus versiforme]|uniref:hypothetical protein n=1 Tax=endosymbiont GvMRE of Glomus versiforme TaxID=2039283 RepID=UPI000ED967A8|nr:hypothetical protein [endosymbiont GvMRE of Glomus versiforme]RHZ37715.1 hypothetical protein GvMRE_I1g521 [endosymbiont GvMRE of Glomus versiforme]